MIIVIIMIMISNLSYNYTNTNHSMDRPVIMYSIVTIIKT
jgi:hypothetical protein